MHQIGDIIAYKATSSYAALTVGIVTEVSLLGVPTVQKVYSGGARASKSNKPVKVRTSLINVTKAIKACQEAGLVFNM